MVPLAPCCLWLLWELQTHLGQCSKLRPGLLLCQEGPWSPRDPAVISTRSSRSLGRCPEDQASVAVVVLNWDQLQPAQGGVCPGAFWSQSAQMFHNNCRLWDKVFYCFVSLQVPRLPSCPLYYSFQAVKVTCLLYFWFANETFCWAPTCLQKSRGGRAASLLFFWSATEWFNHNSSHTEGCSQRRTPGKQCFCSVQNDRLQSVVMNSRITNPGLLRPGWGFLCGFAVCRVGHASQSLTAVWRANSGLSHCREYSWQCPLPEQFLRSYSGVKDKGLILISKDRSGAITFGVFR